MWCCGVFCRIVVILVPITGIQTLNELPWLELIIGHQDSSPRNENQGAYHIEYNSNRGSNLQVTRQSILFILFLYHVFSLYLVPEWFIVNLIFIRTSISYLGYYHHSQDFNPPPTRRGSCGLYSYSSRFLCWPRIPWIFRMSRLSNKCNHSCLRSDSSAVWCASL